nr:ATP-dependent DNA helicase [Actinomycetota bacterium]
MAESRGAAARKALESIISQLPGGEERAGQLEMCEAVAEAIESGEHLVVEAGTGIGKSLAYLVAAVLSDRRVVVATARKPLQDQLIQKDIPFVATALPGRVDAAVLKGRSNYLCLAKLAEAHDEASAQLGLDSRADVLGRLRRWGEIAPSGDLAGAPITLSRGVRSAVTVSAQEC